MITEDYVSFAVAKLLKEKGFEPPHDFRKCIPIMYTDKGEIKWGVWSDDWYPRITLQMAMKWLRKIHNIHIEISIGEDMDGQFGFLPTIWSVDNPTAIDGRFVPMKEADDIVDFTPNSPEEACEEAIKYCLENLI